jgi:hypothetical protein
VFKAAVDLVRVDVNVVDRAAGTPIGDLRAEDFTLTIDGRRGRSPPRSSSGSPRPHPRLRGRRPPPSTAPTAPRRPAASVMLVADTGSLARGRAKLVFRAAAQFVDALDPADRVALTAVPLRPQVDFTANHAAIHSLLGQLDGRALENAVVRAVTVAEALAFERREQNETMTQFVNDLAAVRRTSTTAVRATYGDGRAFGAGRSAHARTRRWRANTRESDRGRVRNTQHAAKCRAAVERRPTARRSRGASGRDGTPVIGAPSSETQPSWLPGTMSGPHLCGAPARRRDTRPLRTGDWRHGRATRHQEQEIALPTDLVRHDQATVRDRR